MAAVSRRRHSNLQCFLNHITPSVLSHYIPKTGFQDLDEHWPAADVKDAIECFTLGDLWDNYGEWSAYGAGAPFALHNGEMVVQYYVPYLSAIQIYTTKPVAIARSVGTTESSESDSWSDDSEGDRLSRSWDARSSDSGGIDQDVSWLGRDRLGHLYLQYFEGSPPNGRVPLMYKVNELTRQYPGLKTFKSVELSAASWMAVAWYPIYHIPTKKNVKDLTACFLTYHTISSSFQDGTAAVEKDAACCKVLGKNTGKSREASNRLSLPPFGLATYKMQGKLWASPDAAEQDKMIGLFNAADSWLKQLRVRHHDYNYFTARFA